MAAQLREGRSSDYKQHIVKIAGESLGPVDKADVNMGLLALLSSG